MLLEEIHNYLLQCRINVSTEAKIQEQIWLALKEKFGDQVRREVRLSSRDRIDFMVEDIGVECKVKGPALGVYRQMERYAEHPEISALLLYSSFYMDLPKMINGKQTRVVHAGLAWL